MGSGEIKLGKYLVVLVHGMRWPWEDQLGELEAAAKLAMPESKVISPPLAMGWLSNRDPAALANQLADTIEREYEGAAYESVILVGYSAGGLIARSAYLRAVEPPPAKDNEPPRVPLSWANDVDRIILLAGVNRGWSFAPTVGAFTTLFRKTAYSILRCVGLLGLLAKTRRGARFITDLRLHWIEMGTKSAPVVQLLGTTDDIVSPEDSIDLPSGSDFIYLDVPNTGHANVVRFADKCGGEGRRRVFLRALTAPLEALPKLASTSFLPIEKDWDATGVTFVIHGIRDYGYWTAHVGGAIVAAARAAGEKMVALNPTYGYFAMAPFLLPWTRRDKVGWLVERYVEARAKYPNACGEFNYVGHSNGTYLLATSLTYSPRVRFQNVVFAGSVVRKDHPWQDYLPKAPGQESQIERLLNYVATGDWVVAIFPRFLARLFGRRIDIGGGGWDGFTRQPFDAAASLNDVEYVFGRHSGALAETHWEAIANFIVNDVPTDSKQRRRPSLVVSTLAWLAPVIWIGLVAFACLPLVAALYFSGRVPGLRYPIERWVLIVLAWGWMMRAILTRA